MYSSSSRWCRIAILYLRLARNCTAFGVRDIALQRRGRGFVAFVKIVVFHSFWVFVRFSPSSTSSPAFPAMQGIRPKIWVGTKCLLVEARRGLVLAYSAGYLQDNYEDRSLELKTFWDSGAMVGLFAATFNFSWSKLIFSTSTLNREPYTRVSDRYFFIVISPFVLWADVLPNMDPLSISASIIAVLQPSGTVVQYLNNVKDAQKDRQIILGELSSAIGFLFLLKDRAERTQWRDAWSVTVESLNTPEGPLEQFKMALQRLASKLALVVWRGLGIHWFGHFRKERLKKSSTRSNVRKQIST